MGDAGALDTRITATRDQAGSWIMVYTPTGKPFQIDTGSLNGCHVEAQWFDPVKGTYTSLKYAQCSGRGRIRMFTPPTEGGYTDWVLVLENSK